MIRKKEVFEVNNPNRKQELSQLSQDALGGAAAIAEAVLLGKVGGKISSNSKPLSNPAEVKSSLGKNLGTFNAVNLGPLSNNLSGTFAGGKYTVFELEKDTILYRAGVKGTPLGQFFSKEIPESVIQTRIDKAVLPVWPGGGKSPLDTTYGILIPKGTKVYSGEVGTQNGFYLGGTQQIVVVEPWKIPGVKVISESSLK